MPNDDFEFIKLPETLPAQLEAERRMHSWILQSFAVPPELLEPTRLSHLYNYEQARRQWLRRIGIKQEDDTTDAR